MHHQIEALFALIFAVPFAIIIGIIIDVTQIGSRIRGRWRHFKNQLSERSAQKLRNRIKVLETQRDQYSFYTASDKALYLYTFRLLMVIIIFVSYGAILIGVEHVLGAIDPAAKNLFILTAFGIGCFVIAMVSAMHGAKITSWDTKEKLLAEVAKLNTEIEDLRSKLEDKT